MDEKPGWNEWVHSHHSCRSSDLPLDIKLRSRWNSRATPVANCTFHSWILYLCEREVTRDKSDRKRETLDLHNQTCCSQSAMKAAAQQERKTYTELQRMSKARCGDTCVCVFGKEGRHTNYSMCMKNRRLVTSELVRFLTTAHLTHTTCSERSCTFKVRCTLPESESRLKKLSTFTFSHVFGAAFCLFIYSWALPLLGGAWIFKRQTWRHGNHNKQLPK